MNTLQNKRAIADYTIRIQQKYDVDVRLLEWYVVKRGQCICKQGFPLHYLAFLVKGKVKIHMISEEGKQLIVAFNTPLELFGDVELVQQIDTLHTIEAVTDVHIAALPFATAHQLRKQASFNDMLLQSISRKFVTKSMTLSFHLMHTADVKLASYFAAISHDEHGNFNQPLIPKSELKMIAEFIGITVRHQNRCLEQFEAEGIIRRIRGFVEIIDEQKLRLYAKHMYDMQ